MGTVVAKIDSEEEKAAALSSLLACRVIVYQELQPSNKGAAGMFFRKDENKLYLCPGIAHLLR